ncbi:polysaccharide biosynthesis/export family protein [Shewanella vesiculosa]|uniref:polysaccharide biosynthesis/export family protein n=1 Tax=Shewanella vesiculosa TaxID=518738 RepID=UPI003CFDBB29
MKLFFISCLFALLTLLSPVTLAADIDDSYRLGAGDTIVIKVFGQDELTLETQITNSGKVNYPFLGTIVVKDMSIKQVEELVYKGLKGDYLVEPNVFVGIVSYRPFYIHGEVKQPGGYPYQPGMTVNQAVALAGGLTERASQDKIFISREGTKSESVKGAISSQINAGDTITIEQRFF